MNKDDKKAKAEKAYEVYRISMERLGFARNDRKIVRMEISELINARNIKHCIGRFLFGANMFESLFDYVIAQKRKEEFEADQLIENCTCDMVLARREYEKVMREGCSI